MTSAWQLLIKLQWIKLMMTHTAFVFLDNQLLVLRSPKGAQSKPGRNVVILVDVSSRPNKLPAMVQPPVFLDTEEDKKRKTGPRAN